MISTVAYAVLTSSLVRETCAMRRVETEPTLVVYLVPYERWITTSSGRLKRSAPPRTPVTSEIQRRQGVLSTVHGTQTALAYNRVRARKAWQS